MDEEPVEILVGMAERGELDPWNIDIVDVTDRFLAELERRKELDLRISGRTLFYAATLLRLKSEYIDEPDADEEDAVPGEEEPDFFDLDLDLDFEPGQIGEPMERLEREIQRRLGRKNLRKRPPVTLYELIKQLKIAEKEQRRRQRRRTAVLNKPEPPIRADDVVGLAHNEGYQQAISAVMQHYRQAAAGNAVLTLDTLSSRMGWLQSEVYIPLLFLMLEGKIAIWQNDFFGEIYIGEQCPDDAA